jgi:uncharacterized membrane protein
MIRPVFFTNWLQQKKTIETLVEESHADSHFFVLLSFASLITTLGLIIGNALIVVGGILVAPLLYPVLALGMGIAVRQLNAHSRHC